MIRAVALFLAALTAAPPAQPRVVVLPRREGDPLPASVDASLRESLRDGLRRGGAGLLELSAVADVADCPAPRCLERMRALGARYVLRATLLAVDRDYALRLELFDTASGGVVGVFDERCALCGLAEARARATAGAVGLITPLVARPTAAAPTLRVATDPAGALVAVDGLPAGRTPLTRAIAPGGHRLRVELDGRPPIEREVTIADGESTSLHLSFAPPREEPPRRPGGRVALAVGVPLLAAGLVLGGFDDRPVPLGCDEAAGRCSGRLDTTWPSLALVAGGAILTTLGAVLVREARRRVRAAASRPARPH